MDQRQRAGMARMGNILARDEGPDAAAGQERRLALSEQDTAGIDATVTHDEMTGLCLTKETAERIRTQSNGCKRNAKAMQRHMRTHVTMLWHCSSIASDDMIERAD